jgi:hypothetical protein
MSLMSQFLLSQGVSWSWRTAKAKVRARVHLEESVLFRHRLWKEVGSGMTELVLFSGG